MEKDSMFMRPTLWLASVVAVLLLFQGSLKNGSEYLLFRGMARALYPQHTWCEHGDGPAEPFALSRLRTSKVSAAQVVVEFDDDPERYFSASPPAAVDYAVVLHNLRHSKLETVMISPTLAWSDADEYAMAALTKAAAQFPRVIFSAGLSRLPQSSEIPEAMLRASLPVTSLRGDSSALPVVNRLAIAKTLMDGSSAWGGFSFLEGIKPDASQMPLMARWGDRVVFSSVLLLQLAERGLTVDGLDIETGKYIHMGETVYPIDEFGQMRMKERAGKKIPETMAHELLDSGYQLPHLESARHPQGEAAKSVVLMDVSQQQGSESLAVQQGMRAALDNLRQVPKLMNRLAFPQLPWWIVWLAYLVLMLMFAGCKMRSKRLLACLSWVACWLLVAVFFYRWMPLTPLVVVMLASAIIPPKKRHGDVAGNEVLSDAG